MADLIDSVHIYPNFGIISVMEWENDFVVTNIFEKLRSMLIYCCRVLVRKSVSQSLKERGIVDTMELELRYNYVKDIVLSDTTKIENGILSVDTEELGMLLMEDDRIEDVGFDVAKPGDSVRILPVKDVVEPRCKIDGDGFPGLVGEIYEAGRGTTCVLKNAAVVTTGPIVGFQEGIIDMSGPYTFVRLRLYRKLLEP